MTKALLAAVAASAIIGAFSVGADAQCYWTGYGWSCGTAGPYAPTAPAPGSRSYYGAGQSAFGYQPRGLPHRFGPEPGGGFYHEGQYGIGHTD